MAKKKYEKKTNKNRYVIWPKFTYLKIRKSKEILYNLIQETHN